MNIRRINKENTKLNISDEEILKIHNLLVDSYNIYLKNYGVKSVWGNSLLKKDINSEDIPNMNDKELQLIFLYKYKNCFVHKDLVSEFVRKYKKNAALDQQVRHLGTQLYWYVINKGAKVPDSEEIVPSGYNYLVSIEIPNPKAIKMIMKRANRSAARNFEELVYVYDEKCATCGAKRGEIDWRTGKKVKLQQGHMDPRKQLTLENMIPQCEYCNQTYQDYFRFNDNGRVIAINNPEIVLKSPIDIQDEMIEILIKAKEKRKN